MLYTICWPDENTTIDNANESFLIFCRFAVTPQRQVVCKNLFVALDDVKASNEPQQILPSWPHGQNPGHGNLLIRGNGVDITVNSVKFLPREGYQRSGDGRYLHFFEGNFILQNNPINFLNFANHGLHPILVPANNNRDPFINHSVSLADNNFTAYSVFERWHPDRHALGWVAPLLNVPIWTNLLANAVTVAPQHGAIPAISNLQLQRSVFGGNGANRVVHDHQHPLTFFQNTYTTQADCQGFILIAQGIFKNWPMNHLNLKKWINIFDIDNAGGRAFKRFTDQVQTLPAESPKDSIAGDQAALHGHNPNQGFRTESPYPPVEVVYFDDLGQENVGVQHVEYCA